MMGSVFDMIAAEPIIYGHPSRIDGDNVHPCSPEDMHGIARRPHQSQDDRMYAVGEYVTMKTDGHIVMEFERKARPVWLKHGKVVE